MSKHKDANGIPVKKGSRIRITGTVDFVPEEDDYLVRVRADRGQQAHLWFPAKVLEVTDEP